MTCFSTVILKLRLQKLQYTNISQTNIWVPLNSRTAWTTSRMYLLASAPNTNRSISCDMRRNLFGWTDVGLRAGKSEPGSTTNNQKNIVFFSTLIACLHFQFLCINKEKIIFNLLFFCVCLVVFFFTLFYEILIQFSEPIFFLSLSLFLKLYQIVISIAITVPSVLYCEMSQFNTRMARVECRLSNSRDCMELHLLVVDSFIQSKQHNVFNFFIT